MHSRANRSHSQISYRKQSLEIGGIERLVHLSVRKYFDKEKSDNANSESIQLNNEFNGLRIEDMTTGDYVNDLRSHHRYHKQMLEDSVYIHTFWEAICGNPHLFKDKIVLEVRCGLGTFSMFCVMAGAKHVYAIDDSEIVQLTQRVINDNKFSKKITVIKGKVKDITLPVHEVDIIVSTCFGENLFISNGFDELLDARDKWLKQDGLLIPDRCTFHIAAMEYPLEGDRRNYWQSVYQFRMTSLVDFVDSEPFFTRVSRQNILTDSSLIKELNLYNIQKDDYKTINANFILESSSAGTIGAIFTFFVADFCGGMKPMVMSLYPGSDETSWYPMVYPLRNRYNFKVKKSEQIYGTFIMKAKSNDFHDINWSIDILYDGEGSNGFREKWCYKTR